MHNALGYAYFNLDSVAQAVEEYKLAVSLQACQGLGQGAGVGWWQEVHGRGRGFTNDLPA